MNSPLYTKFVLFWEEYGGYTDRDYPFQNPSLFWIVASENKAVVCRVDMESKGSMNIEWNADWTVVSYKYVDEIKNILEALKNNDANTFLIKDKDQDPYKVNWIITGYDSNGSFHHSIDFTWPKCSCTELGEKLFNIYKELKEITKN